MGKVVKRIILGFAIILLTFSAIIVLLLIRTYMFNRQYESVLQNVLNLNTIKVESANAAGNITNSCIKEQKVEESGLLENAENMLDYLNQLDESISDSPEFQGNRSMVNSLRQLLVEYKTETENIVALGDGTNFPPLNEDVNGGITSIRNLIPDLSSYCNNNITMELERSAVIQKNIDTNFRRTIYFTLVAFAVVAEEINNLAEKTVELVESISNIIDELQLSMKEMTSRMELGLKQLDRGNTMVADTQNKFVDILTDASRTSGEIESVHRMAEVLSGCAVNVSDSVIEVNAAIEKNTQMIDQIVTIVENQTESQKELSNKVQILDSLARNLGDTTSKFQIESPTVSSEADTALE